MREVIRHTEVCLTESGVTSGMRVGLRLPNRTAFAVTVTACWRIGAVPVLLSTRYTPEQVQRAVQDMMCDVMIADRPQTSERTVPHLTLNRVCACDGRTFGGVLWDELDLNLEQEAGIVLTSGTMGQPRGILHTLSQHYYSALGSHENVPFAREDVWLVSLPLYHVGGLSLVMRSLLHGGTLRFARNDWQDDLLECSITHLSLVPTQLKRVLSQSETVKALQKLKAVLVGGAPCPPALVMRAVDLNIPIHLTYGFTEAASQVTTTSCGEAGEHPDCCGRVLAYRRLRLAEDNEILVSGKTLCKAVVTENKTLDPRDRQGWFHTGDVGHLDAQGRLRVLGRKDAMIISGGENIHPEEIEQVLLQIPEVKQCVVVPVPDDQYGRRPAAFIRVSASRSPSRSGLLGALQGLERFKRPDHFFEWPAQAPKGVKPDRAWFTVHALHLIGRTGPEDRLNRTFQA